MPRYLIPPLRFGKINCFWACAFSKLVWGVKQLFSLCKRACYCAVTRCSNGDFWLNRWCTDRCEVHNCLNSNPPCNCQSAFQLSTFQWQKASKITTFAVQAEPHMIRATPVYQSHGTRTKIEDFFISFCEWGANSRQTWSHSKPWIIFIIFFETFWSFTNFSFYHKWKDTQLLLLNMVYTSCLTSCRMT